MVKTESGRQRPEQTATPSTTVTTITEIVEEAEEEPEIDIVINNVVCSFSVRCHLNLREIALNGRNVEFRRENGMVTMKLRRPYTTASIWSSGRITCTGATSEDQVNIDIGDIYFENAKLIRINFFFFFCRQKLVLVGMHVACKL